MFLEKKIKQIYILVGRKCNFACKYCTQNESKTKINDLPTEINDDIFKFIEQEANNSNSPICIQIYGGEALVYFDKIRYIVNKLKDLQRSGKIYYSTMSNGSFSKEQVQFFNDNDLDVGISWDGHQTKTRGHDIFKENKDNLFSLKKFHVSGVVSSSIYPLQLINDFQDLDNQYQDFCGKHISYFRLDEVYDNNLKDKSILNIDYTRIRKEMTYVIRTGIENLKKQKLNDTSDKKFNRTEYVLTSIALDYINYIKQTINQNDTKGFGIISPDIWGYCGNGLWVYNIDLQGNLYTCHNNNYIAGTIYDSFWKYLSNVERDDNTRYFYNKICKKCNAFPICLGGCKHITEKARHDTYCRIRKAFYEPILNYILGYSNYETD